MVESESRAFEDLAGLPAQANLETVGGGVRPCRPPRGHLVPVLRQHDGGPVRAQQLLPADPEHFRHPAVAVGEVLARAQDHQAFGQRLDHRPVAFPRSPAAPRRPAPVPSRRSTSPAAAARPGSRRGRRRRSGSPPGPGPPPPSLAGFVPGGWPAPARLRPAGRWKPRPGRGRKLSRPASSGPPPRMRSAAGFASRQPPSAAWNSRIPVGAQAISFCLSLRELSSSSRASTRTETSSRHQISPWPEASAGNRLAATWPQKGVPSNRRRRKSPANRGAESRVASTSQCMVSKACRSWQKALRSGRRPGVPDGPRAAPPSAGWPTGSGAHAGGRRPARRAPAPPPAPPAP